MQIKLYNSCMIVHMFVNIIWGQKVKSKCARIIYNFIFSFSVGRHITLIWLKSNPELGGQYLNVKSNN